MDPNDVEPSSAFPEEEKLDGDDNWFSKNLGERAIMSQEKKDELTELKDIEMSNKKHDISNELKEMFEEKSSDAEELNETTTISKHSLDSEITKEDKLKDIVPDDILGKDDSFDGLDNEVLHEDLEHLSYDKSKDLIPDLPDQVSGSADDETQNHEDIQESGQIKTVEMLSFKGKSELLKNLVEDVGAKEIDEIMDHEMPSEEVTEKEVPSDMKEVSSNLDESCDSEMKDPIESEMQNLTEGSVEEMETLTEENIEEKANEESVEEIKTVTEESVEEMQTDNGTNEEEIVSHVDTSSIDLNKENVMVEFAHDDSNQVLIQINTEHSEPPVEEPASSNSVVMETADGQTLKFSKEPAETEESETDIVSQVEGGAEFLQAVTGKLEDVLAVKKDGAEEVTESQKNENKEKTTTTTSTIATTPSPAKTIQKDTSKENLPKCCVSTCKSGKSTLRTTYRYFRPPVNQILYKKWEYIFNQAKQQLTPNSLICELHFRTGLIYKRGVDKSGRIMWALREGALPKLSPSGILRLPGGCVPSPSMTVQVAKKPLVKPTATPPETKATVSNVIVTPTPKTPKVVPKKVVPKPFKTVAQKVSNEVTDIGFLYKNPECVKAAQQEITKLDVLVCGECHSVFHLLELFQAHKMANNCKGESNFKGNPTEQKPQVWAFLLWKSAQAKVSDVESSWRLYQRWCKMNENVRSSWIAAGKFLQDGNMVASLRLVENPPPVRGRVGRPPNKSKISESDVQSQSEDDFGGDEDVSNSFQTEEMDVDNTPSETGQTLDDISRHTPEMITSEVEIKQEVMSDEENEVNKENDSNKTQYKELDPATYNNCFKCKLPIRNLRGQVLCAAGCRQYLHVECTRLKHCKQLTKLGMKKLDWLCDDCKVAKSPMNKLKTQIKQQEANKPTGKSTGDDTEDEEFVVEKIVSRRYNIKKKHFEYLLKWEGYPPEQNTWEPAENLGTCQHLLKAFEEALAKQQAAKMGVVAGKMTGAGKPVTADYKVKPPVIPGRKSVPPPSTPTTTSTGRPQRSSKQKAMDQVKAWCGSIVRPSEYDNVGAKRKADSDSEYDEDGEVSFKKVKVEVDSDGESVDRPRATPSKLKPKPPVTMTTPKVGSQAPKPGKVVNGDPIEASLAAALGLESDEEEDEPPKKPPSLQKPSPVVSNMSSLSPNKQKVLVASAKGVMTVDSKQVPNLSSGIYIMSNKSGIVKVDNDKSLSTLQKSGLIKKEALSPTKSSPGKSGGVVVLPKPEAGTPQQKTGLVKRSLGGGAVTITPSATTPARPPGIIKPLPPGATPRPLGLLKKTTATPTSITKPSPAGKIEPVKPSATMTSPAVSKPSPAVQQKMLMKKKAEPETLPGRPSVTMTPIVRSPGEGLSPQVRSPIFTPRGRGRGGRGRGRGTPTPVGHMLRVIEEPVKETKLVDSDSLLMEFQEPSDSEESSDGLEDIFPNLDDLPPIEPPSPPRPLTLCPETGKRLCKAEGEKTPEPTPPPSPKPPTPPPAPLPEPSHILPELHDELVETETVAEPAPVPVAVAPRPPPVTPAPVRSPVKMPVQKPTPIAPKVPAVVRNTAPKPRRQSVPKPRAQKPKTTTTIVKQDGMICKVEMSPGGTTGTLIEAIPVSPNSQSIPEGTVTIKKPVASRKRQNSGRRGPQLSVMPETNTSMGTITVPARKLFQEPEDDIVTITGEDGMIYQVSNSELAANGLLLSGEEGGQQCVYVTTGEDGTEEGTILTLDSAYADAVAQLGTDQMNILSTESGEQFYIKEAEEGEVVEGGEQLMTFEGVEGEETLVAGDDDQSSQVVAQLVEAGEPAPGGSRRVVLLLPDGNLMMTEVDEEQYAALDLDK